MNDNDGTSDVETGEKNNVIDLSLLSGRKGNVNTDRPPSPGPGKPKPSSGDWEFHFLPTEEKSSGDVVKINGFLKFGPQFIAVVDGPDDDSAIIFAVPINLVKYVKKVSATGEVQGTLSL